VLRFFVPQNDKIVLDVCGKKIFNEMTFNNIEKKYFETEKPARGIEVSYRSSTDSPTAFRKRGV